MELDELKIYLQTDKTIIELENRRAELETELRAIKEQFREIDFETKLALASTPKGSSLPAQFFIERQDRLNYLTNWGIRARKAREHKIYEINEINTLLKARRTEIKKEYLKDK